MRKALLIIPLLFAFGAASSQSFTEIAKSAGIQHQHFSTNYMGGGVAFFDFNQDGYDDIYLTGGTNPDKLYKNLGDGTFEDVSQQAGLDSINTLDSRGVVTGDIDNDGFREIFVARQNKPNKLFYNNGDGTFSDISASSGIDAFTSFSMGASMGDINQDGFLDIYVINYVEKSVVLPEGFDHECYEDWLFVNNGDNTFTEVGSSMNTQNEGCGLAVSFTDYNQDNLIDIFVANDFGEWVLPNVMYKNLGNNNFSDVASDANIDAGIYGMGIATGDYNKDGLFDYYVTNLGANTLHKGGASNNFSYSAKEAGVADEFVTQKLFATGWGAAFFDYDHDGYEDLFVSSGYVPAIDIIATNPQTPNKLFRNKQDGTFEDVSIQMVLSDSGLSRGMAIADFDRDGDMDILATMLAARTTDTSKVRLYSNNASNGNFLQVHLQGTTSNRDGFGAKIKAYKNGELWLREMSGGASHVSQHSSWALLGMGTHENFDSLEVIWNGGKKQVFYDIITNEFIKIVEDSTDYWVETCENGNCTQIENAFEAPTDLTCQFVESAVRNILDWQYSGENADNMIVERSTDGGDFEIIATLFVGARNYTDLQISTGAQYTYRVYAQNERKNSAYSNIITISTAIASLENDWLSQAIQLYPNPTKSTVNILLPASNIELLGISIFNVLGQEMKVKKSGDLQISVSHLKSGAYIMLLETNKGLAAKRLYID